MFKWFKRARVDDETLRQQKRRISLFERGFGWAMVQHHLHHRPTEDIQCFVDVVRSHSEGNAFEDGIECALRTINRSSV